MHTNAKILMAIAIAIVIVIIIEVTKEKLATMRAGSAVLHSNQINTNIVDYESLIANPLALDSNILNNVPDDILDDIAPRERMGAFSGHAKGSHMRCTKRTDTSGGSGGIIDADLSEISRWSGEKTESALYDAMGIDQALSADLLSSTPKEFWAENGYLYKELL